MASIASVGMACLLALVLLLTNSEGGIEIEIKPEVANDLSDEATIACYFNFTHMPGLKNLVSLTLSRWVDELEDFEDLIAQTYFDFGPRTNPNFTGGAFEHISHNGLDSLLHTFYKNPTEGLAGWYRCEAHGSDTFGHPINVQKTAEFKFTPLSRAYLVQTIKDLNSKDCHLNETERKLTELTAKVNVDVDVTAISSLRNERTVYLLTNALGSLGHEKGTQICKKYGAYHAEIDDEEEYLFIHNFIKKLKDRSLVFFTGYKDGVTVGTRRVADTENEWEFVTNKDRTPWRPPQNKEATASLPGYDPSVRHWMRFFSHEGYLVMLPSRGFYFVDGGVERYLCEMDI